MEQILKKLIYIVLLMSTICYGQYDPTIDRYVIDFRQIDEAETDMGSLAWADTITEGDTLKILWSYVPPPVPLPDYWLYFVGDPQLIPVTNTMGLWSNNEAVHTEVIDLNVGHWQVRVKAVGNNGDESPYSGRIQFRLEGKALVRVYIRIE